MAKKEASFRGWLQRVRRTGQFTDVTVRVRGQDFLLHWLPLCNASRFFQSAAVGERSPNPDGNHPNSGDRRPTPDGNPYPDSDRSYPDLFHGNHHHHNPDTGGISPIIIDLGDMAGGVEGFSLAADFCYLIKPAFTLHNIANARAAAQHLAMPELLDATKKFLYLHVFSHWTSSMTYLHSYRRLHYSPVDDYVESRCIKVISAAAATAFFHTKYLSQPISAASDLPRSPCDALTDFLARLCSLPDRYVSCIIHHLVHGGVNLHLQCRQGRNVRAWLDATIAADCKSDRARCWLIIALASMLQKSAAAPWKLELSSRYWCSLLQHAERLMKAADAAMAGLLWPIVSFLEEVVGGSLHELDEELLSYGLGPKTLVRLVGHFKATEVSEEEMEGVAAEVDECVWRLVEKEELSEQELVAVVESFPRWARKSHDVIYAAIERKLQYASGRGGSEGESEGGDEREWRRNLWSLVDAAKLSPSLKERAMSNTEFLCQPHVLEHFLVSLSEALPSHGSLRRENLQSVIQASLILLQENSRKYLEIAELRRKYSEAAAAASSSSMFLLPQHSRSHASDLIFQDNSIRLFNGINGSSVDTPPDDVSSHGSMTCRSSSHTELDHRT